MGLFILTAISSVSGAWILHVELLDLKQIPGLFFLSQTIILALPYIHSLLGSE
jgi:hypothetical protein